MKITAILTCHNRRDATVRCLDRLFAQAFRGPPPALDAVVVDDGSTDGTSEALRRSFGSARVVAADGTLYWARGMQLAESHAMADHPAFLLWLNDDVALEETALDVLLTTAEAHPDAIVVGALSDPETGAVTYSGVLRSRWHPLRTRVVEPGAHPRDADTFNGNVVLIPRGVHDRVGSIDGRFAHAHADFDYGFRARQAGFRIVVAPGTVGTCRRATRAGTFEDTTLPLRRRWELVQSPTGLPLRSHARYMRRHGGVIWPLFWSAPYAKLIASAISRGLPRPSIRP